jgi:hypothetical protein
MAAVVGVCGALLMPPSPSGPCEDGGPAQAGRASQFCRPGAGWRKHQVAGARVGVAPAAIAGLVVKATVAGTAVPRIPTGAQRTTWLA